jgi:error-prone DNA polymerase
VGATAPSLPGMTPLELAAADVWATGLSPDSFPTEFLRTHLDGLGARPIKKVSKEDDKRRIMVGGAVTHRQRPATAGGVTFINLEDETGMINVVCSPGLWARYRRVARNSSALLVRGMVESAEGVTSILADHLEPLDLSIPAKSRDFR